MKIQVKAIVASVVIVALALTAVSGVTYSWFSDTENTEIEITAGKVEIGITPGGLIMTSDSHSPGETIGGSAEVTTTGSTSTVTITNMSPGDKVELKLNITNLSTISAKWRATCVSSLPDLVVTMKSGGSEITDDYVSFTSSPIIIDMEILLPTSYTVSGSSGYVKIYVDAIQNNGDAFGTNENYTISTVSDLIKFAKDINSGQETYSGKTIKLANDLDLGGMDWEPIGSMISYPSKTFAGQFDGNGKTISNFKASDLTPNHATAGFFGSTTGIIKNLTIKNATINSSHYAGGICGYVSEIGVIIENCHVEGCTIISKAEPSGETYNNGDKVGGIIGYMISDDSVTKCTVKNTEIQGYRDIGGIAGFSAGTISDCKVDTIILTQDLTYDYKSPTPTTIGEILGGGTGNSEVNNTYSNVTKQTIPTAGGA